MSDGPRKTKRAAEPPVISWVENVSSAVNAWPQLAEPGSASKLKSARKTLLSVSEKLVEYLAELDPVRQPSAVFDPSNPKVVGRVVGMALLAQPLQRLSEVSRFYGAGIYAIYYKGAFQAYAPISGTEHPIYVGKADPAFPNARTPLEQGEKLATRLREHLKSINSARNLTADDFVCRALVVASGWQEAAERLLIALYQPVWNKETKICYGIGKHGDAAETRKNARSPWDTLHAGRKWSSSTGQNQRSEENILARLREHFIKVPSIRTHEEAVELFLRQMAQG